MYGIGLHRERARIYYRQRLSEEREKQHGGRIDHGLSHVVVAF